MRWRIENSLAHESTLHTCVCATLHCSANQPDPPAITHRWRGPPSFRERGLLCASPTAFFHEQIPTSLHEPKPPSMWKEGDRLRWRIENSLAHESTLHTCSHPCTTLPINCATLQCRANQLGSPAITHRWRGPPSFRERGLCFVALPCQSIAPYVALLCQSAILAGYHPPPAWSPLFL